MNVTSTLAAIPLLLSLCALQGAGAEPVPEPAISYSRFLSEVAHGEVNEVFIDGGMIHGVRRNAERFLTYDPGDPRLIGALIARAVKVSAIPPETPNPLLNILIACVPVLLVIGVWLYAARRNQTDGVGSNPFGKSPARRADASRLKVSFADVAGADEAKAEVAEFVEFLKHPDRFRRLGGSVPRGVLMVGPPGTGKTLLARAIAGEAGVAFYCASGSEFVEIYAGIGASRVRDLFQEARQHAPCIVFIDEIDAVGRRRGVGPGSTNEEREQTLNQLLVEMDGFAGSEGVIVIAATNRCDVLDPALLRPGRFDRQVFVPLPDVGGRERILKVHLRRVPTAADVDVRIIARATPGLSGAALANLVNEAALLAARDDRRRVFMAHLERARDKIMMGAERRAMVVSAEEKRLTAYHEAGHAIVGRLVPLHDPVHRVSIVPRGRAMGVTLFLPEQDRYSVNRRYLESRICSLLGGRVAEELIFGSEAVTAGAEDDIENATQLARDMVTRWGLSNCLGPLVYASAGEGGMDWQAQRYRSSVSPVTARLIDAETRKIIDRNYARAAHLLAEHRHTLHRVAAALMQYETLGSEQIDAIMAGREPRPPADRGSGGSGGGRRSPRDTATDRSDRQDGLAVPPAFQRI